MREVVVCSECRNVYMKRNEEERCPFCAGAPGEVIMGLLEIEGKPSKEGPSKEEGKEEKRIPRRRKRRKKED